MRAIYLKRLDMFVYLFGDVHVEDNECVPGANTEDISDFLKRCLTEHMVRFSTPIDIFFEATHAKSVGGEHSQRPFPEGVGSIKRVHEMLLKLKDQYASDPRARIHFTDYREDQDLAFYQSNIETIQDEIDEYTLLGYIKLRRNSVLAALNRELNAPGSRLKKQCDAIAPVDSVNLKSEFLRLLTQHGAIVDSETAHEFEWVTGLTTEEEAARVAYEIDLRARAIYMDMFTLCRLFRTFRETNKSASFSKCKHAIIYAGDAHILAIWHVLTNLNVLTPQIMWEQERVTISNKQDLQCFFLPTVIKNMWRAYEFKIEISETDPSMFTLMAAESSARAFITAKDTADGFYRIKSVTYDNETMVDAVLEYLMLYATNMRKYQSISMSYPLSKSELKLKEILERSFFREHDSSNKEVLTLYRDFNIMTYVAYRIQWMRRP